MLNKVVEARSKHLDTAVTCLLDLARGAIRAQGGDPMIYAVDIAHELKASLVQRQLAQFQPLTERSRFLVFRGT
jgi:hypothetical protein